MSTTSKFMEFLNGTERDSDSGKKKSGRRAEKGSGQDTHNFMCSPYGSYQIESDELPEFYRLYCDHLRQHGQLSLTEKGTRIGALRVDLDFIYSGRVETHKHTQEQTVAFIKAYMAEVKKYLEIAGNVEVFVMEKQYPVYEKKSDRSKSGIHLLIPSLKTNRFVEEAVRRILVPRMESFFPALGLADKWEKVYDPAPLTHTSNWMILGSKKDGGYPYEFKYIVDWDPNDNEVSVDEDVPVHVTPELVAKFSIRSPASDETTMTKFAKEILKKSEDESRISGGRAITPGRGRPAVRGDPGSRGSSPTPVYQQPLSEALLKYYRNHVDNLASVRYTSYKEWMDVAICLKNIHTDLNDTFLDFSAKNEESYNPREAQSKWDSIGFRNEGARLGENSLRTWSRLDNPDEYAKIESGNVNRIIEESAQTQTEHDVALVVHSLYRDEFKCARFSASAWYRFVGHTWKETDKGVGLQVRLSNDVVKEYRKAKHLVSQRLINSEACTTDKKVNPNCMCDTCKDEKLESSYTALINKLKTVKFTENVMKMARLVFLDEEFANKLDENKNLIAFRNGIFDTASYAFRPGRAEDYISFCTNLDYDADMPHYQHACWDELNRFLHDVMPEHDVRTYFLSYLATCLNGVNEAQKFHILTGSGSNGKSMLVNLMTTAMGDYACKAPISLLTQGRNKSSAAAPELVRLKGRRFVTMQEPDEAAPINTGLMKELASSEKITCRDLYAGSKQMIDFDLQARFNLACNEKPKVNTQDGGTWRRLVVVDYPSKFVADPKLPHEKPIDETFVQKTVSEEWATCFVSYLVHLYTEGKGFRKIVPPEKVMAYTSEYKEDNDIIAKFLREKIHAVEDGSTGEDGERVTKIDVTIAYAEWKRNNDLRGGSLPDLWKRIEALYGRFNKGWTTFRIGD
jgi:P4 family phage/plasmid primase-like protien